MVVDFAIAAHPFASKYMLYGRQKKIFNQC